MHALLITVLIFLRTDCPISNSYAPEIERISRVFAARGVRFEIVFPDRSLTKEQMERYRQDYALTIPAHQDAGLKTVKRAQVRTTPEAAVFSGDLLVYHGCIDNRVAALGKSRPAATEHDLEQVLKAILSGHPSPFAHRPAIGDLP